MLRTKRLSVVIPAAGVGRRIRTQSPKPLLTLQKQETIISRQINIIRQHYPDAEIIVVVGFESQEVIESLPSSVRIVENERYTETNISRSIDIGIKAMNSTHDLLIIYGDLVFSNGTIKNVVGRESVVIVDTKKRLGNEEVGVTIADGKITQFNYGLATKWGQIAYLTNRELVLFKKVVAALETRKWYGFESLNKVINMGGVIRAIEPKRMKIVDVDTSHDLETARKII